MMEVISLAYFLTTVLLAAVCGGTSAAAGNGQDAQTLYFLSMAPYEVPGLSVQPLFTDGDYFFADAEFVVNKINNRSDILGDYRIELIAGNGGCDISTIAYVSFVSELIHSGKQIVGIVGPTCSDSAVTVSTLCSRSEISLVTVHIGNSPLLADREVFPYAFTNSDTTLVTVDAAIALMKHNNWRTVAFLYEVDTLVFAGLVQPFQEYINSLPGYTITFSSPIFYPDVPLNEVEDSFARIIFLMMSRSNLCRLFCLAYQQGFLFPTYQFVSVGNVPRCDESIHFTVDNIKYACSREEQLAAMSGTLSVLSKLPLNYETSFDDFFIDGVWSLAMALNNSIEVLEQNNFNLSNYQYGRDDITQIIQEEFYQLDFEGVTGRVTYERDSGSRNFTAYLDQQLDDQGSVSVVGLMDPETGNWNLFPNATVIPDSFPSDYIHVSEVAAAFAFLFAVLLAILVVLAHIFTVIYQDYKSVKASSPRLNQFVYIGCYLILFTVGIYTVMATFEVSYGVQTAFCNITIWFVDLGFTLILGTVLVKTWRLYHIFVVSSARGTKPRKLVADWFLALIILLLLSVDVVICLLWSAIDPLVQESSRDIEIRNGDHIIEVKDTCKSKNELENVMIPILAVYKVILMACSVCLAFLTRHIDLEDFKTNNVALLIYLFAAVGGLGLPIFLITQFTDELDLNVPFVIFCFLLCTLVTLCLALLFFPPLYPLLLKKYYLVSGQPKSKYATSKAKEAESLKEQDFKHTF